MINAIIKGIFWLITKICNILLFPVVSLITALFPSLSDYFSYIVEFFSLATTFVRTTLNLLLIEQAWIRALFDYFIISSTIYYTILAVRFAINIYKKFKL